MAKWFYRVMGDELGPLSTQQLIESVMQNTVSGDTDVRKDSDTNWTPAMYVEGLFAAVDKRRAAAAIEEQERKQALEREEVARIKASADAAERDRKRWDEMRVSTCGPLAGRSFQVIDTIFAMDSSGAAGLFSNKGANPHDAFTGVKEQLMQNAFQIGAHAVVNCQFEYRVAVATNAGAHAIANLVGVAGGQSQCIEIFAYGTAIAYDEMETTD